MLSCSNGGDFSFTQDLAENNVNIIYTDTISLWASTFKEDSIVTSGTGVGLVGSFTDGEIGKVSASSYFEMANPPRALAQTATFKSLKLCLHITQFYGDTTKPLSIEVRELTKLLSDQVRTLSSSSSYFFNTSEVCYDTTNIIGAISFIPVNSIHFKEGRDSIEIPLSETLGDKFFNEIQGNSVYIQSASKFLELFKGIALRSGNSNSCALRFDATSLKLHMNLYYSNGGKDTIMKILVNTNTNLSTKSDYQFNQIKVALGPKLQSLKKQENTVPSDTFDHTETFCQAGIGLATKLQFPYLKNLQEKGNIKILKAQLILSPVPGSYNLMRLPTDFNFYTLKNTNLLNDPFMSSSNYSIGKWTFDYEFNEDTHYTFDITKFITNAIGQTSDIPSIGVTVSSSEFNTSLNRVAFNDFYHIRNATKLKIWYWRY